MGDFVKIAVKTGLVVTIMAAIFLVFSFVDLPALDFTYVRQGLGTALAVVYHYLPIARVILPLGLTLVTLELAIYGLRFSMVAIQWIMKVNE